MAVHVRTIRGEQVEVVQKARDVADTPFALTYGHAAVHRDTIVNASHIEQAGTGDFLVFFTTANDATKQCHLEFNVTGAGPCEVYWYRSPDVATAGTALTPIRLFDSSTKPVGATVSYGGTVNTSDYGTLIKSLFNGGGGAGGNLRGGSSIHDDVEFVLALDTTYCLRVNRLSSQIVGVEIEWYEVPEIVLN